MSRLQHQAISQHGAERYALRFSVCRNQQRDPFSLITVRLIYSIGVETAGAGANYQRPISRTFEFCPRVEIRGCPG